MVSTLMTGDGANKIGLTLHQLKTALIFNIMIGWNLHAKIVLDIAQTAIHVPLVKIKNQ